MYSISCTIVRKSQPIANLLLWRSKTKQIPTVQACLR